VIQKGKSIFHHSLKTRVITQDIGNLMKTQISFKFAAITFIPDVLTFGVWLNKYMKLLLLYSA
jgi:hypothetical protein